MSAVKYYINGSGAYLGATDGAAPAGGTVVPIGPDYADSTWNGNAWVDSPARIAAIAYQSAISNGCQVVSTGTPAINGTYALDSGTQTDLANIAATCAFLSAFPGGGATFTYPDINGAPKTFPSVAVFKAFYAAYSTLVFQLQETRAVLAAGGQANWPSQTITIA